jgi:sodium-coupled neutral amino acid transporter 11
LFWKEWEFGIFFICILVCVWYFVVNIGGMCGYTVIIGDTLPIVMRAILGLEGGDSSALTGISKFLTDRRVVTVLASYLIMLPISSVRNISSLAKFSVFGLSALILILVSVWIAGFNRITLLNNGILSLTVLNPSGIIGTMGTLCFAYVCHRKQNYNTR